MSNEMAMQMGMEDEELLLPPSATPVEITPPIGRDEALHGGSDEDVDTGSSIELPPTPTIPARKPLLTTFKTAIAAAVGRHKTEIITRDAFGKEAKRTLNSQDVTELENKAFAELQLSETKDKWNIKDENLSGWQKFGKGVERFFDRMWRGTATENFHRVKEYKHGLKLSATAGIEGAISAEFNTEIDRLARKRIEEERQGFWKKTLGKTKDFFQETFALERDLHRYKVEATAKLRADFEANPTDPTNPIFHLINRDITAREEVALRLRETPLELLKESHTKNTKVESIKLESEAGKKVETFLKEKILGRVIDDALARNLDRTKPNRISDNLRPELDRQLQDYFFSDEFQAWRKTLTPEQQAAFENSFTYATDVLNQAESVLIPSVLDNVDHYQTNDRLNFDIELTLGTTQYSANSEAKRNEWGARSERASMNQAIWDKTRRAITGSSEATYLYRSQGVNEGLKRERFLSAVSGIVSNEVVAATTGLLATKGAMSLAHSTIGWIPFLGSGIASGTASGIKEWGRLNRMRAQYGFEESVGLSHPQAVNAKKSEQMRKVDYHRVELGRRVQQLSDMTEKLNSGSYTDADLLQTLGYLADSKARIKLSDHYGINLLTASKDTPEGRAIYQREIRLHDLARATTTTKLKEVIDSNGALGQSLGEKLGLTPGTVHQTDQILAILTQNLEVNLETGTQIPVELQVALGSLTIQEAESIQARDQAFNKLRWGSTLKRGAITGILAGGLSAGLHQFAEAHETVVTTNTNTVEMEVFNHTLPTHTDTLNGIGHMTHPDTGEVITMHAQLPHGTHLVVDPIRVGGPDDMQAAYNLVGANNEVLVRGMQFTGDGHLQMTHEIRDALAHNHINYEAHPLSPITWATEHNTTTTTEIDPSQWTHSLTYEQMGGAPDTFFNNNVNQILQSHPEYADVDNGTFINGLRYTLRGMENHIYHNNNVHINQIEGFPRDVHFRDSIWGSEFVVAPQADNAEITNLPDFIATADGNERVMRLIHESIEQYKATEIFTDEAHRIAYEMSHIGTENHVPDENEIKILVEYLGGNSTHDQLVEHASHTITPHDAWFTATETLTRPVEISLPDTYTMTPVEWWNALIPTGFTRPLETPTGNVKVVATPIHPPGKGKGKGKGNGSEKRPDAATGKGTTSEESASFIRPVVTPSRIGDPNRIIDNNEDTNRLNVTEGVAIRPDDPNEEPALKIDNELDDAIAKLALELDGEDVTTESNENSEDENKRKELSDKIILNAYTKFIPKLRSELKSDHLDREDWVKTPDQAWLSNGDLIKMADKYNLPIAFMRRHMYNGPHFIVLVKPPVKLSDDKYKVEYYDPKADGIQSEEINLNDLSNEYNKVYLSNGARHGEVSNDSREGDDVVKLMSEANYDLTIPESVNKKFVTKSLTSKTQVGPDYLGDGHNCGPLALLYAVQAAVLRDKLKKEDIEKWEKDYDYPLLKKEVLT